MKWPAFGDFVELRSGSIPALVVDVDPAVGLLTISWKHRGRYQEALIRPECVRVIEDRGRWPIR